MRSWTWSILINGIMLCSSKVERSSAFPVWSIQAKEQTLDVDRRAMSNLARDHERSHVVTCIHFGFNKLTRTVAILAWRNKESDAIFNGQGRQNTICTFRYKYSDKPKHSHRPINNVVQDHKLSTRASYRNKSQVRCRPIIPDTGPH